jgi:DNA helicase II / ATP-dependent DNA helicase PcrA
MDLLELNSEQHKAVTTTEGPLLILAGAGSGKTRVITYRIAYLINEKGVRAENILAVTFTNKAASEMRQRIVRLLEGSKHSGLPLVSTFHSLCVRILRKDIEALQEGYTRSFTIYDQDDSLRVIKQCIRDLGFDEQRIGPRPTQSAISHAKNNGLDPADYAARADYNDEKRAAIARVFRLYQERLKANNALDFDDLLIITVRLLRKSEEVRGYYNSRFKYILVDEYQDTNSLQFALIRLLTETQQNICVVGDDDQSIYKWRGADLTNILSFEEHYPKAVVIRLEQNYRSTQNILDLAGAVVKNNSARKGKNLWTSNPSGSLIRYYQAPDSEAESRFIARKIEEHQSEDPQLKIAVLYRTNAQSRLLEEALRRVGISYNIVGGFSFYERAEVRDVIAYLKLALNPNDSIALTRVINSPARGIGKQTLDEIDKRARDFGLSYWQTIEILTDKPEGLMPRAVIALRNFRKIVNDLLEVATRLEASEVVKHVINETGYLKALKAENSEEAEGRIENLQELVNAAVEYDQSGGLREFIDASALVSDSDQYKEDAKVTLMTIHSAKGLEFPVVFMIGLEEGLFPHSRSQSDPSELEEERRLCYVAITRAEKYLYLTHSMRRRVYGEEIASEPSQFLNEMPVELIEDLSRGSSWLSYAQSAKASGGASSENSQGGKKYSGKTYDSVESIAEFFRLRKDQVHPKKSPQPPPVTRPAARASSTEESGEITPGMYVKHPKYGRGLVLRREGVGDAAKLTVSFPGFGYKKLIEKFAGLTRA